MSSHNFNKHTFAYTSFRQKLHLIKHKGYHYSVFMPEVCVKQLFVGNNKVLPNTYFWYMQSFSIQWHKGNEIDQYMN